MERYLSIIAGLFCPTVLLAQSTSTNYVMTETMLDSTATRKVTSVQYYDGLGRPSLRVEDGIDPSGKSIYTRQTYDTNGREKQKSLPVVGTTDFSYLNSTFFNYYASSTYSDSQIYSETSYDALGRPTFVSTPGQNWNGKGKRIAYITNEQNSVRKYKAGATAPSAVGYYPAASLTGEIQMDEDNVAVSIFYDMLGRKILERRGDNDDTYFVYSANGLLRYILQPMHQETASYIYRFRYDYDALGRLTQRRLPGCALIKYWYDAANHLVAEQDSRLSDQNLYRFYLYDGLGRLCVQGVCSAFTQSPSFPVLVTRSSGSGTYEVCNSGYYVSNAFSLTDPQVEIVNYYDDYTFLSTTACLTLAGTLNFSCSNPSYATTLLTGTITATSDGHQLLSVNYYDEKGRVADTRQTHINGDFIQKTTSYNFTDNPTTVHTLLTTDNACFNFKESYYYNEQTNQLSSVYLTNNGEDSTRIASYTYNKLGRTSKILQGGGLICTRYNYNLHGWLTSISSDMFNGGFVTLFNQGLDYETGTGTPRFNGNISSMNWRTNSGNNGHGYKFTYDLRNRLSEAHHCTYDMALDSMSYSETMTYDRNCNIRTLFRTKNGQANNYIDKLTYTYLGNHLKSILDSVSSNVYNGGFEFVNGVNNATEYTYTNAGDQRYDKNKNIALVQYDLLGHPTRVQFRNGNVTEYIYAADGRKLRQKHTTAVEGLSVSYWNTLQLTPAQIMAVDSIDYIDNLLVRKDCQTNGGGGVNRETTVDYHFNGGYLGTQYQANYNAQGGLINSGWNRQFHYYIRDYQGNNRVVVNDSCQVEQTNDYYAYGGPWGDTSNGQGFQPFKYNGKELDRVHGLDWYDYGARRYDPAYARFTQMDPLCEKYPHLSQYAYCAGNPVNAIDPDGRNPIFNRKGELLGVDDWGMRGVALFFDLEKEDFELKYSHEEALKLDLGIGCLIDEAAKEQYLKTYNDLPNRPDWDGYITLSEANHWYRHGDGETLYADLSKINLSGICSLGESFVGQEKGFNLLMGASLSINDGLVYGNISLKRYPNHTVRAFVDRYNFEMHSWRNPINWIRNFQTIIGELVAGDGTPYNIYPYGSKKLRPILPWLK